METPKQPQLHSMTPIAVQLASWGVHIIYQIPWEHPRSTAGQPLLMNNAVRRRPFKTMPVVRRPTPGNDQRSMTTTIQNDPRRTTVLYYKRPTTTTKDNDQRPPRTIPILRSLTTNNQRQRPPRTIPIVLRPTTAIVPLRLPRTTSQPPVRPLLILGSTVKRPLRQRPVPPSPYYVCTNENYCQ